MAGNKSGSACLPSFGPRYSCWPYHFLCEALHERLLQYKVIFLIVWYFALLKENFLFCANMFENNFIIYTVYCHQVHLTSIDNMRIENKRWTYNSEKG